MASEIKKISGGIQPKGGIVAGLWVNNSDTSNNLDRDKAQWNKAIPFSKGNTMPKTRHNRTKPKGGQRVEPARREKGFAQAKGFSLKAKKSAKARREDLRKKQKRSDKK